MIVAAVFRTRRKYKTFGVLELEKFSIFFVNIGFSHVS